MTELEKLYECIDVDKLKALDPKLSEDILAAVDKLEEQLIETEILPVISRSVEPLLSDIKRELVLLVEYHPGRPVTVALSRKAKITDIAGTKQLYTRPHNEPLMADEPPVVANSTPVAGSTPVTSVNTPVTSDNTPVVSDNTPVVSDKPTISTPEQSVTQQPHEPVKHVKNNTKGLKVTFPDGTVICCPTVIDTFVQTLNRIGFDRVAALGITHGHNTNLVSREMRETKPDTVWQHQCDDWYIYSNISNHVKRSDLQEISDRLGLGLIIEEGKPE